VNGHVRLGMLLSQHLNLARRDPGFQTGSACYTGVDKGPVGDT
jgi:hypothetical protein